MLQASLQSTAQSVEVKADKRSILIGERIQYDITCILPSPGYAVSFRVPDSVSHFVIVENKAIDSIAGSNDFRLHKRIFFTSFDSGSWHIPSVDVQVERSPYNRTLKTDSIPVEVGYSPADSTGSLRDIKSVIEVTVADYTLYYIIAGVLLLILAGLLFYRYVINRNKYKGPEGNHGLPAFDEAMAALSELEQSGFSNPEQVKNYHTSLAVIFKRYCSRKSGTDMMNRTTGEILLNMQQYNNSTFLSKLAEALRCGDAVKFAKFLPAADDSTGSLERIREAIRYLEEVHLNTKQ